METMKIEYVNGYKIYMNADGKIVAVYDDAEQLIFKDEETFKDWVQAESEMHGAEIH